MRGPTGLFGYSVVIVSWFACPVRAIRQLRWFIRLFFILSTVSGTGTVEETIIKRHTTNAVMLAFRYTELRVTAELAAHI